MTDVPAPPFRVGLDVREWVAGRRTGIGRYLMTLVEHFRAPGSQAVPVLYANQRTVIPSRYDRLEQRVMSEWSTLGWDQVVLPRALGRDAIDVFLSPYYKGPLVAPCPVVITIHDLFFIGYPGRWRPVYDAAMTALARLYARRAAAIVTDSECSKRAIVTRLGVSQARVRVIPVALGPEFTPRPPSDIAKIRSGIASPYILYVGNFKPHKNLRRLIAAYARLPETLRAGHALVLAGGDREGRPALEALAARLGVADRVIFPGLISDGDLPALYAGASVFVLPSLEEGFGLPALEAMACGAPVVASDRGALPEVVADAGLTVDAEKETELTDAMTRVLSDSRLAEDLRSRGLARAPLFSSERTAGRVLDVLHDLAEGHR